MTALCQQGLAKPVFGHICSMSVLTSVELPPLRKMVRPALLTFSRSKQMDSKGIDVNQTFRNVKIETEKLELYKSFFGFTEAIPLCFLYLFAQRAQAHLMLQKTYGLPIPGTIHLQNSLSQHLDFHPDEPFTIQAKGTVPYKPEGSLLPTFKVDFFQHEKLVASCESLYLVKRKSKQDKSKKREKAIPKLAASEMLEKWKLDVNTGISYAEISDDHNPIHKSKTVARMAGLKHPIAQGWYMISRAVQAIESERAAPFRHITNHFHKPHFLPGESSLHAQKNSAITAFELQQNGQLLLQGELKD